ncbi:MAG: hypothetical protein MJ112_06830 [Lachnospiraceae bacterium]|nr:hypothetical protein [Lachnospiraceae bacterium]
MANSGKKNIKTFKIIFERFGAFYWSNRSILNTLIKNAGLTKDTFERLINRESISLDTFITICKVTRLSSDYLLGFTDNPNILSGNNHPHFQNNLSLDKNSDKSISYQIPLHEDYEINIEAFEHMIGITDTHTIEERYVRVLNWFYKIIKKR